MDFTSIVFGLLFTCTGVLFAMGKLHGRIAAWKNMPEEEKAGIRIVPLCRNIGEMIGLSGLIFLAKGFWPGFSNHWFVAAMIAWLAVAGFDLYYIEKSHKYENR